MKKCRVGMSKSADPPAVGREQKMTHKMITKARTIRRQNPRQCRTFAGYIGLLDGRPDVDRWPTPEGLRTIHVFLSERQAKKVYEDVALVTITGVWKRSR